jgi:hypothetical protein
MKATSTEKRRRDENGNVIVLCDENQCENKAYKKNYVSRTVWLWNCRKHWKVYR